MNKKKHPSRFEIWEHSALSRLTFNTGQYTHFSFPPHFHEHYVIQMVDYGVIDWRCGRKRFQTLKDQILIINPGEIHTGSSYDAQPLAYKGFCPEVKHMHSFLRSMGLPDQKVPEFTSFQLAEPELTQKIKTFIQISQAPADRLQLDSLIVDIFSRLFRNHSNLRLASPCRKYTDDEKVKIALAFIRDNHHQAFSLDQLSRACHSDPCYLIKLFKKKVGLTPYQYLRNYRIEVAKKKLLQDKTVSQVAHEVGFFDQSHFHRNFKPIVGMTPFQYKRQFRTRSGV